MTRADRLAAKLPEHELDAVLVIDLLDVRYVTGFTGSSGLALVADDVRRFLTDFRYEEQAAAEVEGFDISIANENLLLAVAGELPPARPLRLGFDPEHLTVADHGRLARRAGDDVELVAAAGLVAELRAIKEPEELAAMRASAALSDEIYAWIAEQGLIGRTERDVAVALEHELRLRGAEPAFESIVAGGPHGALPHATPRDVAIERDTFVVIDLGARLDGYCSDCTRTFATGDVGEEAHAVYDLVLRAQVVGRDALAAGASGREVDATARAVIDRAGYGKRFGHGLGHGVGLGVHEPPRLTRRFDDPLAAGNVVTVEPGVYIPGRFGVRIEDEVVVTEDGHEVLTEFTKELTVVG